MDENGTAAERVAATVAAQIRESGVQLGWLCERSGIPYATMRRRLNGATAFDLNELDRIAQALRMSIRDLLGDAA